MITSFAKKLGICYPALFKYMTYDDKKIPKPVLLAVKYLTRSKVQQIKDRPPKK